MICIESHFSNKISKSTESLAVFLNAFLFQEFSDDFSCLRGNISKLAVMIFGTIETKSCRRDASSTHDDHGVDIHLNKSLD